MPDISIKAETLVAFLGFRITNSLLLSWVAMVFFVAVGLYYRREIEKKHKSNLFYIIHVPVLGIRQLLAPVLHEKTNVFYPLLGAYFFYILINNWFGLLPGVGSIKIRPVIAQTQSYANKSEHELRNSQHKANLTVASQYKAGGEKYSEKKVYLFRGNNTDLNATLSLALITMVSIQIFSIKYIGLKAYLQKFFTLSNPINTFVGILELISEISRIISFSFRLFGNIFAGKVMLTIIAFLVPVAVSFPFLLLEVFVGAVQALVFTMISGVLIAMGTVKAHHT
jgi:F-type H+-transporting ATPase subunit a